MVVATSFAEIIVWNTVNGFESQLQQSRKCFHQGGKCLPMGRKVTEKLLCFQLLVTFTYMNAPLGPVPSLLFIKSRTGGWKMNDCHFINCCSVAVSTSSASKKITLGSGDLAMSSSLRAHRCTTFKVIKAIRSIPIDTIVSFHLRNIPECCDMRYILFCVTNHLDPFISTICSFSPLGGHQQHTAATCLQSHAEVLRFQKSAALFTCTFYLPLSL